MYIISDDFQLFWISFRLFWDRNTTEVNWDPPEPTLEPEDEGIPARWCSKSRRLCWGTSLEQNYGL